MGHDSIRDRLREIDRHHAEDVGSEVRGASRSGGDPDARVEAVFELAGCIREVLGADPQTALNMAFLLTAREPRMSRARAAAVRIDKWCAWAIIKDCLLGSLDNPEEWDEEIEECWTEFERVWREVDDAFTLPPDFWEILDAIEQILEAINDCAPSLPAPTPWRMAVCVLRALLDVMTGGSDDVPPECVPENGD